MLECETLTVRAGWRVLLAEVDLRIAPGEVVAVLGENGAGKSTLLRVLAGERLWPALRASGWVRLNGRPIERYDVRACARLRAVLPQQAEAAFSFTALEVAALGRYAFGGDGLVDRAVARQALALADAAHLADRELPTLSGGERARVHMAAAFAQLWERECDQPRYLLLDEPTAALDLAHQHDLLAGVRGFAAERGIGVLAILHDLNLAAQYADRVFLLREGRLLAQGAPAQVLTPERIVEGFAVAAYVLQHPLKPALLVATAQRTTASAA